MLNKKKILKIKKKTCTDVVLKSAKSVRFFVVNLPFNYKRRLKIHLFNISVLSYNNYLICCTFLWIETKFYN